MRIGLLVMLAVAFTALPGAGQSFFSEELSPRAVSLGGAFVGLADDASAALWNPAGLFTLRGVGVLGRLSMPALTTPSEIVGAAVSGGLFALGGALWYGSKTIKSPTPGEQSLAVASVGAGVRETMAAGVSVKLCDEQRSGQRFRGMGVDIGLMARFGWVQGGLTVTDVLGTQLFSDEDSLEIPMIVRMGAALKLWDGRLNLLGAVDLARHEEFRTVRVGGELWLFEGIALRAGWNGREITWGAGFGILKIIQSDFAWQAGGWALSAEIAFGRR